MAGGSLSCLCSFRFLGFQRNSWHPRNTDVCSVQPCSPWHCAPCTRAVLQHQQKPHMGKVLPHTGNQNVVKPAEAFFSVWKRLRDELVRREHAAGHKCCPGFRKGETSLRVHHQWGRGFSGHRWAARCSAGEMHHTKLGQDCTSAFVSCWMKGRSPAWFSATAPQYYCIRACVPLSQFNIVIWLARELTPSLSLILFCRWADVHRRSCQSTMDIPVELKLFTKSAIS